MLKRGTPNLMSPVTGRELTPGDREMTPDPVVVASKGSSLSHSS
jgi:hypothetical protein